MNVLAIGCHPDDIETLCAGTLARFSQLGHIVTICHVANGNMGHTQIQPDELRQIRRKEARSAGSLIGAEVVSCDIGDLLVDAESKEQKDKIIDVIRQAQPDLIITHSPEDYMPDHVAVSRLVFAASFTATLPHYETSQPGIAALTPIYYMDTLAGIGFQPEEYVDISETIGVKLNMLKQHESQLKWMADHDQIDFPEFVLTCARYRGLQCGVTHAEAFRVCRVWPRVRPERLLP